MARMANGSYVVYSRDPHLAAIGFVWNPLMSVLDIVPLLARGLWSPLATHDMAGAIVSALCMVGAVHQIRSALREWGLGRAPRLILVVLFALNPMIVFYAANGMTEALYIFTLVATARYLSRWLRSDDLHSLAYAGAFLGLCYLARNEGAAPAFAAAVVVLAVSRHRASGPKRSRNMTALTETAVFISPFAASFGGWAMVSFIITGQPFGQFSSQYGTAQIAASGFVTPTFSSGLRFEAHVIEYMAPLLPLIVLLALALAWRRKDPLVVVPVATVGAGLAFDVAAFLTGGLLPSYRYWITAIPLEALLAGVVLAPGRRVQGRGGLGIVDSAADRSLGAGFWTRPGVAKRAALGAVSVLTAVVLVVPSLATTWMGMFSKPYGNEETAALGFIFHRHLTPLDRAAKDHYAAVLAISGYIAHLHLRDGSVVVDNFSTCAPETIVTSADPRVFVIPNDRDFQRILADPLLFHTHYLLVPKPVGVNTLVATNRAYPSLYDTGAGFTTLAHQFPERGLCPPMRLYRVFSHPSDVTQQQAGGFGQ